MKAEATWNPVLLRVVEDEPQKPLNTFIWKIAIANDMLGHVINPWFTSLYLDIDETDIKGFKPGRMSDNAKCMVIIRKISKYYGITEYHNKIRKREQVIFRQMCMCMMLKFTKMSLGSIGEHFGKDHATVLHAKKTINNLIETNREVRIEYNEILSLFE